MRKFLPVAIFGLIFSSVLVLHAIFDQETSTFAESTAKLGVKNISVTENKKFEDVYGNAVWPNEKGEKITPSKLKSKIQIVNFWASWCLPCLEEMPSLLNLKKKYGDDKLQVVAVNTDDEDQMKKLMKTMKKLGVKNEFVHILDSQSKISDTFGITAIPVTMVFSNGKLLEYNNGPVDFQSGEFVAKLEKWLK